MLSQEEAMMRSQEEAMATDQDAVIIMAEVGEGETVAVAEDVADLIEEETTVADSIHVEAVVKTWGGLI